MTASPSESHEPCGTVLIADDDLFEAGYVISVLEVNGVRVVGPIADLQGRLAAAAEPDLKAAIVAHRADHVARTCLVTALESRGIPYLTLTRATEAPALAADKPVLTAPFAAYQVAEWVLNTLQSGQTGASSNPPLQGEVAARSADGGVSPLARRA